MGNFKQYFLLATVLIAGVNIVHAEIEDDIYYNPKKAAHKSNQDTKKTPSNYISDFQNMDVDYYNSRGQYYATPIDTIGYHAENGQDFVYTTQIQKYYNPTIVVDNENILSDVLDNSYGNVTIEYNLSGIPTFGTWWGTLANLNYWNYGWYAPYSPYYYPYYYGGPNPWAWGSTWSWSWGWGPSWTWGWGPSWSWGWGPSWGYGPSWGWSVPTRPSHWASYRPNAARPIGPRPGWSSGHGNRPGSATAGRTPGASHRNPTYGNRTPGFTDRTPTRPGTGNNGGFGQGMTGGNHNGGNSNVGYGRQPGQGAYHSTSGNRGQASTGTGSYSGGSGSHRGSNSSTPGSFSGGNRGSGSSASGSYSGGSGSSHRGSNSGGAYRSSGNSGSSYQSSGSSSGSYRSSGSSSGSYRSSGSSSGGYRSSGGSMGGGSRGGGGGSRGGRR